jgi:hypothetical protein
MLSAWRTKLPIKFHPAQKLDILTAEKVFGWNNVHKHDRALVGKKQDKRPSQIRTFGQQALSDYYGLSLSLASR